MSAEAPVPEHSQAGGVAGEPGSRVEAGLRGTVLLCFLPFASDVTRASTPSVAKINLLSGVPPQDKRSN